MAVSRNVSHEKAMIIIYDALCYEHMNQEYDPRELISSIMDESYDLVDLYVKQVVIKALINKDAYIEKLQAKMDTWKFDRLNRLNQAILLMSLSHYYGVGEVEKAVVINVAVSLAKKYLDDNDYKFVNAILDNVLC